MQLDFEGGKSGTRRWRKRENGENDDLSPS